MSANIIKLSGTVRKVIDHTATQEPQQAQIHLSGADYLYDELRILNSHNWKAGTGISITIRLVQQAGE
jgi:hypothetical protein